MTKRIEYKYIVAVVVVFGLFMELLDMTIVNVAIPGLAREFGASATSIEWVITGYLLALAAFIPISAWSGSRFGTKRSFVFALATFTLGSLLCATAWNSESLIAFRILQGMGGGMAAPVGTTLLFHAFPPEERSRASALLAVPASVAPASGPVLGGYLVEYQSWEWIFLINVPIGVVGTLAAIFLLKEYREEDARRLDLPGFVLSATGLASLLYGLAEAGQHGFDDRNVLLFGLGGLALLALFVVVELRTRQPLIDVRIFRNRLFSACAGVQMAGMAGFAGALFLLPIFLQMQQGLSPFESGLATFPQALGVLMLAPLTARLYPRIGPQRLMLAGAVGGSLTTFVFMRMDMETTAWWVRGVMLARGMTFALMLVPLQTATFATITSAKLGEASALFNIVRQVASSLGVALLATVLTNRLIAHHAMLGNPRTSDGAVMAFQDAFLVAGGLALLGIVAALFISDREAAPTMRRAADAEPAIIH
ncbi:MAG: multidrug efflux MFS transporter [Dehalococcoidia bacterium]|nr:DHA2 family efflux MFS transporter permease subunit [Chloroflexi bacterium CFX7]MCK6564359.1 multidrug efflux MFS transporter [Dehalococcoidia bacterium]NUQ54912.1 multidrug efflux MFS transporter [Dehalococcoidia bacterium]RIL03846.1 MAG: MFS transporter [bacterium]